MQTMIYRDGERPLHEYLRLHARRTPDKAAFIWYGRAISWRELDRDTDALAAELADAGVGRGDRVALFMQNCPQYVQAHCAVQKLGAIVVPCGPLFREHELRYQLQDVGARVMVASDDLWPVVDAVRAETALERVYLTHYGELLPAEPALPVPPELLARAKRVPPGAHDLLAAIEARRAVGEATGAEAENRPGLGNEAQAGPPAPATALDEVGLLTYTSGTTGLPKGAMLTLRNALFKSAAAADCNGVRGDDVLLAIAPLYHIAGMVMGINVTVYTGATTVLLHRFDPVAVLHAIERHRVTWWYSIAPMNVAVMNVPDAARFDLSSLRVNPSTSFGIALTEPLAEQWRAFTGAAHLFEAAYGLSESHTVDTFMPQDAVRWGTQGRPVPGVEVRILDPQTGRARPAGEPGEIVLRSAGNFLGYWNKPEATAATLRDDWVHTGDMGCLDEAGYLTFMGRFKEMIKVSGYSVFPEEVESILIRHPAVAQAAVIGIADAQRGEVVKAVVVLRPGLADAPDADALIAWARQNMSAYKVPRVVEFRNELPATGAGKVLRRLLKDG